MVQVVVTVVSDSQDEHPAPEVKMYLLEFENRDAVHDWLMEPNVAGRAELNELTLK